MPVMVTGADNPVGREAIRLLRAREGEVRVFLHDGEDDGAHAADALAAELRSQGCKVAHGHLDDEAHMESALEQVHTVLHLLGRPTDDADTYLERTATVIGSAIGAGCRRLVLMSDLSVADAAGNSWLGALAEAEDLAAEAPMESVVLRCATIHAAADPLTVAIAAGALGLDPPGAHWPVAAVDVATTAVLADAERDVDSALHILVPLTGPRRYRTADYAAALSRLLPAAAGAPLPADAVEMLHRTVDRPDGALGSHGTVLTP